MSENPAPEPFYVLGKDLYESIHYVMEMLARHHEAPAAPLNFLQVRKLSLVASRILPQLTIPAQDA